MRIESNLCHRNIPMKVVYDTPCTQRKHGRAKGKSVLIIKIMVIVHFILCVCVFFVSVCVFLQSVRHCPLLKESKGEQEG